MLRSSRVAALCLAFVIVILLGGIVLAVSDAAKGDDARHCSPGESSAACAAPSTGPGSTTSSSSTSTTRPARPQHPRLTDGSIGNQATRMACKLLSRSQIGKEFGGPVGPATPTYPYCQWLVGKNSFLALAVEPHTSFNAATQYVATLETVSGLGSQAIIANNRYLYFTEGSTSYWLLWQYPGDFSTLDTSHLVALGHDVIDTGLPSGRIGLLPPVPAGPPIYFAGDSTVAGPEWAWWAYHENSTTTRTLAEYQVGTGMVRPDFFDWPRHLLAEAAERRPKLVIWMGSANDDQEILVNGAYRAPGSRLWDAAYAKTVGEAMQGLLSEGCKVLWIGEPAVDDPSDPSLNSAMQVIDRIYAQEAARHPGVEFYNPGTVLNTKSGGYAGSLWIDGVLTPVRLDGVHLNIAGSEVLANAIAPLVNRLLGISSKPHHAAA
jgi:lysophospholipase L1-like esterase